ncbi:arylesterase [Thiofaba sp. EF100]|uniref:arylesterase n=1 Tax=Thiofaba sp. EF100 TaxID=3121274 RepID=UPI0032220FE7
MRGFLVGSLVHRSWLALAVLCITLVAGQPAARATDVLLIVGDSLSAGYGVNREQAWPSLLQKRLHDAGLDVRVVNASISGETSASGRARLPALLERHRPRWAVVELGANDGLRGLALDALRANLKAMLERAHAAGAVPILAGMRLPPNYGSIYTTEFAAIYAGLGREYVTIPFLLDGVAGQPQLNQPDGIHPNAEGHRLILENVWAVLAPVLGVGPQVEGEKKTMLDSRK